MAAMPPRSGPGPVPHFRPGFASPLTPSSSGSPPSTPPRSSVRSPATTPPSALAHRLKFKTEYCKSHGSSKGCPFGDRCHFAHSKQELREVKIMDLFRAGEVKDVDAYRTRPCMSYVSTGSCPFGNRCCNLHDPRVIGTAQSWLPHCERPVPKLSSDVYVDNLHHQFDNTTSHGTPFAELIPKDVLHPGDNMEGDNMEVVSELKHLNDWKHFYARICSGTEARKNPTAGQGSTGKDHRPPSNLSERHRLEIALKMRGGSKIDRHKYCPNHEMLKESCMVLQTRTFRTDDKSPLEVRSMSDTTRCDSKSKTVVVREVAFGNDSDPSVRGVALWFGVPSSEVIPRTYYEIKEINATKNAKNPQEDKTEAIDEYLRNTTDDPFYLIRPSDEDSFKLTTSILTHRLQTLQAADMRNVQLQRDELASLNSVESRLQASFESLCRHWASGAWDVTASRGVFKVDKDTPRPHIDDKYQTKISYASLIGACPTNTQLKESHTMTSHVWESFAQEMRHAHAGESSSAPAKSSRLATFLVLSQGISSAPASKHAFPRFKNQKSSNQRQRATRPSRTRYETLQMYRNGESEWGQVYHFFHTKKTKECQGPVRNNTKENAIGGSKSTMHHCLSAGKLSKYYGCD